MRIKIRSNKLIIRRAWFYAGFGNKWKEVVSDFMIG